MRIDEQYDAGDDEDGETEPRQPVAGAEDVVGVGGVGGRQVALHVAHHPLEDFYAD